MPNLHSKTMLSIDNDEWLLQIVQIGLEVTAGWDVLIANEGSKGIALATTEQPDVILLDILMPGMDGIQILNRLRAGLVTQKIPIIFFTCRPDLGEQLRQAGDVHGIISKPFDVLTLSKTVDDCLA
ncbi:response regulator [Acaryochloris marina NIES-2412]|uniref:response regulator n=1 Tax=Acaryochloris marina TaxID=155978 RepID=UPI00405835D1